MTKARQHVDGWLAERRFGLTREQWEKEGRRLDAWVAKKAGPAPEVASARGPWSIEAECRWLAIMFGRRSRYSKPEIDAACKQLAKHARLRELESARLAAKFGDKAVYSMQEIGSIVDELAEAGLDEDAMEDPDAVEAVYEKLAAAEEPSP